MNASNMHNMAQQPGATQSASQPSMLKEIYARLSWRWPWYAIAFCAAIIIGKTGPSEIASIVLCIFTMIAVLMTLKERIPETVIVAATLAVWMILRVPWRAAWQEMLAFSGLCVLLFLFQFIWQVRPPVWPAHIWPAHASALRMLAAGGQAVVVLVILFGYHGPLAPLMLAHVGAIGLFVLALLVLWAGYAQDKTKVRYWCSYLAGLLVSATLTWESLVIWNLPQLRWLVGNTPPVEFVATPLAMYLTTIAPFLMRRQVVQGSRPIGYICALAGPALLLGPSLVSFFQAQGLLPVLLLLGESLGLFLLGNLIRPAYYLFIYVGIILSILADLYLIGYSFKHQSDQSWLIGIVLVAFAIVFGIIIYIFFTKKK